MRRLLVGLFFFLGLTVFFNSPIQAQPIICTAGSTVTCPNRATDKCVCGQVGALSGCICTDSTNRPYGVDPNAGSTTQGSEPQALEPWTEGVCVDTNGVATLQGFGCIFQRILGIIVPLLGLALFVLLLVGGFQYMTAGGDPKQTQKAAGTITTAVIGIVVVIGAWFIFQILNALTGINLLKIVIPG